jgi:FkbM family methyltransferase
MAEEALRSNVNSGVIQSLVPGHQPIDLVAYYARWADHYRECELQTKRWFVENVHSDWIMFDVGAHIGYYSILFSRLASVGHVYAFEPTETFFMLEENLAYNACRNVTASQTAVGMVSGAVEDNVFRIWGDGPERRTYDFSTLDDLVLKLKLTRLDCIKIDVDSFDFEVLMGAEETLRRLNPWIVVELCHTLSQRNQTVTQALEWLMHRGYRTAHVVEHDNFVFRRDSSDRSLANEQSLRLTFENRPVSWVKDSEIKNPFVSDPIRHNLGKVAVDEMSGRLTVDVPGPRWAYACSWRRREDVSIDRPFIAEVKLQVSGASVGLGCVSDDFSKYITKETNVNPNSGVQTASVYVESITGHLVLRNVDVAARHAQVVIHEFRCFTAARNLPC